MIYVRCTSNIYDICMGLDLCKPPQYSAPNHLCVLMSDLISPEGLKITPSDEKIEKSKKEKIREWRKKTVVPF